MMDLTAFSFADQMGFCGDPDDVGFERQVNKFKQTAYNKAVKHFGSSAAVATSVAPMINLLRDLITKAQMSPFEALQAATAHYIRGQSEKGANIITAQLLTASYLLENSQSTSHATEGPGG